MPFSTEVKSRSAELAELCARLRVRKLELFGSAMHSDSPRDLDFLVDLGPRPPSEYASVYFELLRELEALFDQPVDLITPAGLANPYFRQRVEEQKTLLYER